MTLPLAKAGKFLTYKFPSAEISSAESLEMYIDCQKFFPIAGYGAVGAQLAVPWWARQAVPLQKNYLFDGTLV
jgi:hypothetical protein